MSTQIKDLLKKVTKDVLTDETLNQIDEAFQKSVNEKISLHVEKALNEQDEEYAEKLKSLLEAIDNDHTVKLDKVVKSIDENHSKKFKKVIQKFDKELNESAKSFKNKTVDKVSNYLDVYLEKAVPTSSINEAVKNKKARLVLEKVKSMLAVDSAMQNKVIKSGILEGKQRIDESTKAINELKKQNKMLQESVEASTRQLILEKKTANLDDRKKRFILNMFEDKNAEFITENFDYAIRMFEKTESNRLKELKDEVIEEKIKSKSLSDVVVEEDSKQTSEVNSGYDTSRYMPELTKY